MSHPVTLLGADIGGTHITCAAISPGPDGHQVGPLNRKPVDASADADTILDAWSEAIAATVGTAAISALGLAMPGPFDYPRGVSLIRGLAKFDALYGMNVGDALRARLGLDGGVPIAFENDVNAFVLGEWLAGAAMGRRRVLGLTLGTGFGSGFLVDGCILADGDGLPPDTTLGFVPYRDGMAEDYISRRGLCRLWVERGGSPEVDVAHIADDARAGDARAAELFHDLGRMLADVLAPYAVSFDADVVVIGGAISRSYDLFRDALLARMRDAVEVVTAGLPDAAGLLGAADLARRELDQPA